MNRLRQNTPPFRTLRGVLRTAFVFALFIPLLAPHAHADLPRCQVQVEPIVPFPGSAPVWQIAVGDLDGDGDLDAVRTLEVPFVEPTQIFWNDGSGGLIAGPTIPSVQRPRTFDYNLDGAIDLIASDIDGNQLCIMRNLGGGNFSQPSPVVALSDDYEIADWNLDGYPDLILKSLFGDAFSGFTLFTIHLGDGGGQFNFFDSLNVNGHIGRFAVKDFTGTGYPDLLCPNPTAGSLNGYVNDFGVLISSPFNLTNAPGLASIEVADIDFDGKLDLFVGKTGSSLLLLKGIGAGLFNPPIDLPFNTASTAQFALADFDEDGFLDLYVERILTGITSLAFGDGTGAFSDAATLPSLTEGTKDLVVADFDGDGDLDILQPERFHLNRFFNFQDCDGNGQPDSCDFEANPQLDCNGNGIYDPCDLTSGFELDENGDGVPDSCQRYRRGDSNRDDLLDLSDAIGLLQYLFGNGDANCKDASDANDDGAVGIADAITILSHLFGISTPPVPLGECEVDQSPDNLDCLIPEDC